MSTCSILMYVMFEREMFLVQLTILTCTNKIIPTINSYNTGNLLTCQSTMLKH